MKRTAVAAHRGSWVQGPPENTLEAFTRAAQQGATWVEVDVRRLGDGTLVLLHDADLGGHPLVDLDLDGAREIGEADGVRIPTLEQALRHARALGLKVDIELKEVGTEGDASALAQWILAPDDYVYTSFHDRVIARLDALDRHARAGLLLGRHRPSAPLLTRLTELYPEQRLRACCADFAAPNWRLLRLGFVRRVRAAGYPIWVWTVNDERRLRRLLHARVDMIITDRPERALALREAIQPSLAPLEEAVVGEAEAQLAIA